MWNVSCIPIGRYHARYLLVYEVSIKSASTDRPANIPPPTAWRTKIIDIKALPSYNNNGCELCFCKAMVGSICPKKTKNIQVQSSVLFAIKSVPVSFTKKSLDICYYKLSFLWSCNKAPQLNVGKSWKRLFFWRKIKIPSLLSLSCTKIQILFCKSCIIYNIRKLLCTVKCPKVYFFFPSAHTYTVQDSLHLHASNASHIFWS